MRYSDVWKSLMILDNSIPFVFMGRTAAIIENDMLKVIQLEFIHRYREIRVTFGIMALCDEYCLVDISDKELSRINPRLYSSGYPGPFLGNTINIGTCELIVSDIIQNVIPLFKKTIDAGEALSQLIRIDEVCEQNRLCYLDEIGGSDRSLMPFETKRFWNDHYFYLAMKSFDYDFMCDWLKTRLDAYNERILELNKQINEPQKDQNDKQFLERRRGELLELIEKWTDYLKHAEIHDMDYFNKVIIRNEQRTLHTMPKQLIKI